MLTDFPEAIPGIPVSDVEKAAEYYVNVLVTTKAAPGASSKGSANISDEYAVPRRVWYRWDGHDLAESG